jgi:hypothetical protein
MSSSAPQITPEIVAEHGLSPEEYDRVLKALGREPNLTELGIFSVMWSEHCSYKSSRIHLKKLPTQGPQVICGPGENAGVVDIGDGQAAIFKMESHNHPSYIEPYQGAATGVGGILRDVFTMGARPIANMNALRFGRPDHPKMRHLISGVVRGIGGYGNCVGVPTVGGEVNFHPAYDGNILVNAMTVGLCRIEDRSRRHSRRDHGLGRFRRGFGRQAPDRAGWRPLHRKAADRGMPGTDGVGRHRRDPGHGRCGPHLLQRRDGVQGRRRHSAGHGYGAPARNRHDRLRDDAVGKPGADAHGSETRSRSLCRSHFPQMGAGFRHHRHRHRHRSHGSGPSWRNRVRHPARAAGRRCATL